MSVHRVDQLPTENHLAILIDRTRLSNNVYTPDLRYLEYEAFSDEEAWAKRIEALSLQNVKFKPVRVAVVSP